MTTVKNTLAGLLTTAVVLVSSAAAEVPRMARFVGSWHAHEEALGIRSTGQGHETYADRSTCPDAPMAGCGIAGTTDFMLTSLSGDTATGVVTAASNPKQRIGGRVTIRLIADGLGLELTVADGDQGFPFCNNNDSDAARRTYCGA